MLSVDRSLVEVLNRAAQHPPLRQAALVAAGYLFVMPVAILVGLAAVRLRRRASHDVAVAVLALAGAGGAVGLNQLAGHLRLPGPGPRLPRPDQRAAAKTRQGRPVRAGGRLRAGPQTAVVEADLRRTHDR